ncbi:MAG: hypothetical protein ACLSV2_12505 [Clostridium sp.]
MKIKKKLALVMATAATITSLGGITAFANNSSDTPWNIGAWSGSPLKISINTEVRPKTDASSAYGRVLAGNNPSYSSVSMQLKNENGGDLAGGKGILPAVQFSGNVERYIPNYANEHGYKKVRMQVTQSAELDHRGCNGLWSPDSY